MRDLFDLKFNQNCHFSPQNSIFISITCEKCKWRFVWLINKWQIVGWRTHGVSCSESMWTEWVKICKQKKSQFYVKIFSLSSFSLSLSFSLFLMPENFHNFQFLSLALFFSSSLSTWKKNLFCTQLTIREKIKMLWKNSRLKFTEKKTQFELSHTLSHTKIAQSSD